jgi:outer membrane protein
MLRYIPIISLSFTALCTTAQNKWSLQKCIEYAYTHNLQLQQTANTAKINDVNYLQSKATVLPNVNGSFSNTYNFGKTIDRFTNQFVTNQAVLSQNLGVSANLTLFNGLQQWNTIMQQKYAVKAAEQGIEAQKQTLALNIATFYLSVNYSKALMGNTLQQVNVSKSQVERMKKMVDAGAVAKGNLLDLQSQQAQDELTYVTAESNYNIALLNLKQILNLDTLNSFEIESIDNNLPVESIASYNVTQIYEKALSIQPAIKQSEFALKSSEKALSSAWGGISPNISLSGGLGTGYSGLQKNAIPNGTSDFQIGYYLGANETKIPVFTTQNLFKEGEVIGRSKQFEDNLNRQIGIQINVPIFNGLQTHSNVQRSKITVMNSKLTLDVTKQTLFKNIAQAYADAKGAFQKFKAAEFAESAAKESFKYADQRFTVGAISNPEFLNAKNRLQRAEIESLQNRFDYILKLKVLEFYEGKPLQF